LAGERPFGLGFGAVREMLAEGKPWLDGASTLEWPHNEFVRLYVEAGPLGLGFALLLVGALARTALRAAARDAGGGDPARRTLLLAIAADIVAEACLQNLFNAVHHATVLVVFLALAAAATRGSGRAPAPATNRPGQVPALAPT
jgi:O-antigen ligase